MKEDRIDPMDRCKNDVSGGKKAADCGGSIDSKYIRLNSDSKDDDNIKKLSGSKHENIKDDHGSDEKCIGIMKRKRLESGDGSNNDLDHDKYTSIHSRTPQLLVTCSKAVDVMSRSRAWVKNHHDNHKKRAETAKLSRSSLRSPFKCYEEVDGGCSGCESYHSSGDNNHKRRSHQYLNYNHRCHYHHYHHKLHSHNSSATSFNAFRRRHHSLGAVSGDRRGTSHFLTPTHHWELKRVSVGSGGRGRRDGESRKEGREDDRGGEVEEDEAGGELLLQELLMDDDEAQVGWLCYGGGDGFVSGVVVLW